MIEEVVKKVILDGKEQYKAKCPDCEVWAYIDDDQFHGRVSIQCECGYHETIKFNLILAAYESQEGTK